MVEQRMKQVLLPAMLALQLGCLPPRLDLGPQGEATSAEELLRRVAATEGSVLRLSGEGRLQVNGPDGRAALGVLAVVGHPASLHLELLDFFGRPQLVLATDGARFEVDDVQGGRLYRGPATAAALGRVFPIPLAPAELVALLLGRAPRLPVAAGELSLDRARARYLLTLRDGAAVQHLEVDPASARVLRSTLEGARGYRADFSGLEPRGGVVFPGTLQLELPSARTALALSWRTLSFEPADEPGAFELQAAEGRQVVELDAQGRELPR
jgi:Domain of unknown function (DUF4292)